MPRRKGDAKAAYKLKDILDPSFELPTNREDLMKVYRTAAKAADQRLVRLEKLTSEENFKIADKWAYARAQRDIEAWSGADATRFNTAPPGSMAGLKGKIEDIRHFLEAPTSTKTGIKQVYVEKAKTINDKYGTKLKWDQVGKLFESDTWRSLDKKYGSKTAVKMLGTVQKYKDKKKLIAAVKKADTSDLRVPDDQVGRAVKEALQEHGKDILDTLGI